MNRAKLVVRCPTCARPVPWGPESPERPFCSARCRQIDFGDWAAERHRIPGEAEHDAADPEADRDAEGGS